jgi:hypothetical protein
LVLRCVNSARDGVKQNGCHLSMAYLCVQLNEAARSCAN